VTRPDSDRLIGELMRIHAGRHEMYREDEAHAWLLANGFVSTRDTLTRKGADELTELGERVCQAILAAFCRIEKPRQGELF
jgi:hypothetical protein